MSVLDRSSTTGTPAVPCRRPGCGRAAVVAVSYHAVDCEIRVVDVESGVTLVAGAQPLCSEHARRLHPLNGWVVVDRRRQVAQPAAPADAPQLATTTIRRRWGGFDTPRAAFDTPGRLRPEDAPAIVWGATAAAAPAPVAEPTRVSEPTLAPETTPATETTPTSEAIADPAPAAEAAPIVAEPPPPSAPSANRAKRPSSDDPLGKPKGRMLSRAFEATGHQRTVLSDPLGAAPPTPPSSEAGPDEPLAN